MVSAKKDDIDKIRGLGLGADDTDKLKLAITFVDDLKDDNNVGEKEKP